MTIAFSNFKEIKSLSTIEEKHRTWLKDYEGLYFSIAEKGPPDSIRWKEEKDKYVYSDKRFNEPIECIDGKYRTNPNKIQRHKRRLVVEFDDKLPNGDKDKEKCAENSNKVKEFLKKEGYGFIESTHNGSCNYLWVEFTRDLTMAEAKKFLLWIAPEDSEIDLNFASDFKRFPVLFADHWKYSKEKEIPIEYFEGKQIDYDSLSIGEPKVEHITKIASNGFQYPTAIKQASKDYSPITMGEFLSQKQEKERPIIKKFFPEKSIGIIFGEPASCKSLFLNYIGSCVATGKKFLEQYPTRKMPVLLLSSENPERTDRKRLNAISKGMRIIPKRRKFDNLQLFYCGRSKISVLNDPDYYAKLEKTIKENEIKLLMIDTISPLIMDRNDNLANEIVEVFNNRLFPLIDKFNLSIILTMHSQKSGKDFLGSVKIKASSDVFYELSRENNTLSLLAHKNREGEHNLKLKIDFIQNKQEQLDKVTFGFIEEFKGKQSVKNKGFNENKLESCKEIVLEILEGKELKHKEIVDECKTQGQSESTSKRAISSLYEAQKIKKKHDGGYYIA